MKATNPQMQQAESDHWSPSEMPPFPRPAGFIRRVIATLIDALLIGLLFQLFMFSGLAGLSLALGPDGLDTLDFSSLGVISLSSLFFVQLGYFTFFHTHCGQTPGKMTLRIIVVSDVTDTFVSPSPAQAFFRALGLCVSASFFGFGLLLSIFGRKKRALHDFLCGTQVLLSS